MILRFVRRLLQDLSAERISTTWMKSCVLDLWCFFLVGVLNNIFEVIKLIGSTLWGWSDCLHTCIMICIATFVITLINLQGFKSILTFVVCLIMLKFFKNNLISLILRITISIFLLILLVCSKMLLFDIPKSTIVKFNSSVIIILKYLRSHYLSIVRQVNRRLKVLVLLL